MNGPSSMSTRDKTAIRDCQENNFTELVKKAPKDCLRKIDVDFIFDLFVEVYAKK